MTGERLAVVSAAIGSGAQPTRIMHFPEGFTILDGSVAVEDEDPEHYSADDLVAVCEHCLLERHPGLEQGLVIAEEHGEAEFVGGSWVSGHRGSTPNPSPPPEARNTRSTHAHEGPTAA